MADILTNLTLYYIFPGFNGLGGPVRALLEDAQVPYEWVHIEIGQKWRETKQDWIDSGYPFDCAPKIRLADGRQYSGAQPILRFLSNKLGKYIPKDNDDLVQFVDAVSDYALDWFRAYGMVARNRDQKQLLDDYLENQLPVFLRRFDRIYGVHQGPYAAGNEVSYCDFVVFILSSTTPAVDYLKDYPNLSKFVDAMRARPTLKKALESQDYAHTGLPPAQA